MINVRSFLNRTFHWKDYNCWDFVREVWLDHSGVDIGARQPKEYSRRGYAQAFTEQEPEVAGSLLTRLPGAEDPCIVLMERPGVMSHIGIYTKYRLLHIQPRFNVLHQDWHEATIGFTQFRYYK